jgi:uncharacterized membrane protein
MFCAKDRLDAIETTLRIELRKKDREIESLRNQLEEARIWARKWRQKAKHLRTVRRDLTEKLTFHEKPVA